CVCVAAARWSRERRSSRGRGAPVSITTRRLRPGPPPWRGLIGRFGPSAMGPFSHVGRVERGQRRFDADGTAQDAREGALVGRPLEAGKAPAGVHAATGLAAAGRQPPVLCDEAAKLRLRRFPAAAGAGADGSLTRWVPLPVARWQAPTRRPARCSPPPP